MRKKPQTREERLAAALRANLKRRKEAAAGPNPGAKAPPVAIPASGPNAAKKPD